MFIYIDLLLINVYNNFLGNSSSVLMNSKIYENFKGVADSTFGKGKNLKKALKILIVQS